MRKSLFILIYVIDLYPFLFISFVICTHIQYVDNNSNLYYLFSGRAIHLLRSVTALRKIKIDVQKAIKKAKNLELNVHHNNEPVCIGFRTTPKLANGHNKKCLNARLHYLKSKFETYNQTNCVSLLPLKCQHHFLCYKYLLFTYLLFLFIE